MNKKGDLLLIVMFFIILFLILFAGFIMVTGSAILNWVFDETVPELTDMGMVGDANMTEIASYTIVPLNTIVQQFTWLTGVIYLMMLIGSIGFAYTMKITPNRWLIGFYFAVAMILILGSIFVSNMYEEFYDGTDDLATRLKEHTILSFMILYSPTIFTIITFATGIVLFSGMQQEEFT